jgi:putative serine protease PepD
MSHPKAVSFLSAVLGGVAAMLFVIVAHPFSAGSGTKVVVKSASGTAYASQLAATSSLTPRQVYERDAHGVVSIRAIGTVTEASQRSSSSPFGAEQSSETVDTGTGIVVSGAGLIVTNDHVVDEAHSVTVTLDGEKGETVKASIVAEDKSADLALLKINAPGVKLHTLSFADSSAVQVGEAVDAIGNPYGLDWTLTTGVVSALDRQIKAPDGATISGAIQTDASLNPGNSGGPLIDAAGEVIGINSQIISGSSSSTAEGGSAGVGFAIASNTVESFLQQQSVSTQS